MNQSTLRTIPCLLALVTAAYAGPVAGVTGAAAGHAALPPPALPHVPSTPPPPPPSVSASAAAQGAAAAAGAAGAASHAGQVAVHPDADGVNANATMHASAAGEANGLSVATVVSGGAAADLDVPQVVRTIHEASFTARDTVAGEVQTRIDAGERHLADLEARADKNGSKARSDFATARREARAKQKAVRADLKAATKADGEVNWGSVQSDLAKDYRAYADAVVKAEAAANTSPDKD
ncbi:MAG TPA: hypothetical protein VL200_08730 [Lacunisphaera sp.]|jgi:hypothetical protein|nr:hypothetical protein [Lacunisphaera sp.]